MKELFRYRRRRDVESFGGVDIHGLNIGPLQALDLLDGLNEKPMCEKRSSKPRAVDTCDIHSNPKLMQRDPLKHSVPPDREVGIA